MLHQGITQDITGLQVARLLNFKHSKLEWKRMVPEKEMIRAIRDIHA